MHGIPTPLPRIPEREREKAEGNPAFFAPFFYPFSSVLDLKSVDIISIMSPGYAYLYSVVSKSSTSAYW